MAILAALSVLVLAGCMQSEELAPGKMSQLYQLSENVWPRAAVGPFTVGSTQFPARFVAVYERDSLASVLDLAGAPRRFTSGGDTFQLLVSDDIAAGLARSMRRLAAQLQAWGEASELYPSRMGEGRWANDTAAILATMFRFARGPEVADPREDFLKKQRFLTAAAPLLRAVVIFAMRQTNPDEAEQHLSSGMIAGEKLPVTFVLRGAFRLARLRMPPQAPDEVLQVFEHGPPTSLGVEYELRGKLLELRHQAEKDSRWPVSPKIESYLEMIPVGLDNVARILEQWDNFYLVSLAIGKVGSNEVISLVVDVRPGRTVWVDALPAGAPVLTLEGRTRINLWTSPADGRNEMHAQFISERGGRVAVRFESWIYGPISLLAFPIEDWGLRELTVVTTHPERHRTDTTVNLLLESAQGREGTDLRRVMRIETVRRLEVTTTGDRVDRVVRTATKFDYFTPQRRWSHSGVARTFLPEPDWQEGRER
jgi:hypothetical protein